MDAMSQIAQTLGAIPSTPQEKRRAKNRRYYERNKQYWQWWELVRRLRTIRRIIEGAQ